MKMNSLTYAAVDQLTLESLRLESCREAAHEYIMQPAPVERFVYITAGQVCFSLASGGFEAGAWDMIYLPRDTAYHSRWLTDAEFVVVDLLLRDGNGQDIRFGDDPCVLFHDTHHIYSGLLKELADKADASGPFDWLERLSLCFKLLCQMARDTNREELDANRRQIQAGLTYLESNYNQDFSVDVLAKMCNMSVSNFRRLFFACKGMSAVDYRNRLRIRKAAELLRTGNYTVNQAAEQVGIADAKYFGKLFKRYTGTNPGIFKHHDI